MESHIQLVYQISELFKITKEPRQRCCISPTLIKIYAAETIEHCNRKCKEMEILINDNFCLYSLWFSHDQVICTNAKYHREYIKKLCKRIL